jgi:putative ATP-dependent endonuclease of the OLD family
LIRNLQLTTYDYNNHLSDKIALYASHPNVRFYGQNHNKGKTFEYEICLFNMETSLIITDSISNKDELLKLFELYKERKPLTDFFAELRKSDSNQKLEEAISAITDTNWTDEDKMKAIVASRFLASVGKGENALELANSLEANFLLPDTIPVSAPADTPIKQKFNVPDYINDSMVWICQ